jgi:protoporphyrin/coproporphyrin ferrochelatase
MSHPAAEPVEPDPVGPGGEAGRADPAGGPEQPTAELEETVSPQHTDELEPYDAVVLVSFGGPEAEDEVMPFLRRVTRGRGIPDERLAEVGEHYYAFGGRSPINDQNRALLAALRGELDRREIGTPLLWANRFSEPFIADTLRTAHDEGMSSFLVVTTSAYSSYSSCRAYREDLAEAVDALAEEGRQVRVDKIRQYYNHPGFASTNVRLVTDAVREVLERTGELPTVVFVTHSVPDAMDDTSGPGDSEGNRYSAQHQALAAAITEEVTATLDREVDADLAYCSRSGPPSQPWLEPDVNDHLRDLAAEGVTHVVLAPIGFVSDHMEVVFDLDTEARETADDLGLDMVRVPTVGVDPQFVSGLVDLALERAAQARGADVVAPARPVAEPVPAVCPPGCCPNLRIAKPACCGAD